MVLSMVLLVLSYTFYPVWAKNERNALLRDSVSLRREKQQLHNEVLALQLQIRKLSSRERLEELAGQQFGLRYTGRSHKVLVGGVEHD
jgi:cell division protein FtsL